MLEILFWLIVLSLPAAVAYYAVAKESTLAGAAAAGGILLIVIGAFVFNFHLVRGGQVGVALRGGNADTFTGFKITGLGTKVVVFDRSIPLDLNVDLDGNGRPTERTVALIPADGSQVYLDARAVVAIDSRCTDDSPRRCVTNDDKDQIAALAVQFRKGGQDSLERYITGVLREKANLVAAGYENADTMINVKRAAFLAEFNKGITDGLTGVGFDPTLLVVEQLVPSAQTQERLNAIQAERANTNLAQQQVETSKQAAARLKVETDAATYDQRERSKADADGILARGEAYAANPTVAEVDMAKAYGEGGNAVVVTNGQAEVRPVITQQAPAPGN